MREALCLPDGGIQDARIGRVQRDIVGTGACALVEHLLPGAAAITGAENTALLVRTERMAECRDVGEVCVTGMDLNLADMAAVAQPDVDPAASAVGRAVDPITMGDL